MKSQKLRHRSWLGLANMQVPHVYGIAEWRKKCPSLHTLVA